MLCMHCMKYFTCAHIGYNTNNGIDGGVEWGRHSTPHDNL